MDLRLYLGVVSFGLTDVAPQELRLQVLEVNFWLLLVGMNEPNVLCKQLVSFSLGLVQQQKDKVES